MKASDVMTRPVVSVAPETSVTSIARLLIECRISAVPVIGADQRLLGIVSEGDLIRRAETGTERGASWWLELVGGGEGRAARYLKSHGLTARDVMTPRPVTVAESTPLKDVAALLERKRIKRVPVVRKGRVVGIVSRANLVQALVATASRPAKARRGAHPTRESVLRDIGVAGESSGYVNAVLEGSVVHLWGGVRSEAERAAIALAARRSRGVTGVKNHIAVLPPGLTAALGGI